MRAYVLASAALVLLSFAPALASADALRPAPTCEPGFLGRPPRRHDDSGCDPIRCRRDSDCARPGIPYESSCQAAGLCMLNGTAITTCEHVGGACGEPSSPGRCVSARLCMPITPPLPPGGPRSAAPAGRATEALALGVPIFCVGLVSWDLRRRRRR